MESSGIIPARAGFTCKCTRKPLMSKDHPRSRGVYGECAADFFCAGGSSPLARGLPRGEWQRQQERRIIPARAGFTLGRDACIECCKDHPRSRGVYSLQDLRARAHVGSSPLARGLRHLRLHGARRPGIIPARAGFTLGDPWNPNDHSPYQTASAFTADLAPARRCCGSAAVERRSTMTPSEA